MNRQHIGIFTFYLLGIGGPAATALADTIVVWEAQLRSGNGNTSGDWEIGIGPGDNIWSANGQFNWVNERTERFRVQSVGSSVVLTLGGTSVSYVPTGSISQIQIWIQAKQVSAPTTSATVTVGNMTLNTTPLPVVMSSMSSQTSNGTMLSQTFLVSGGYDFHGDVTFSWNLGSIPRGSRLDVHILGLTAVPEPSTFVLYGLGLLFLGFGGSRTGSALDRLRQKISSRSSQAR